MTGVLLKHRTSKRPKLLLLYSFNVGDVHAVFGCLLKHKAAWMSAEAQSCVEGAYTVRRSEK